MDGNGPFVDALPLNSIVIFHGELLVITRCYFLFTWENINTSLSVHRYHWEETAISEVGHSKKVRGYMVMPVKIDAVSRNEIRKGKCFGWWLW